MFDVKKKIQMQIGKHKIKKNVPSIYIIAVGIMRRFSLKLLQAVALIMYSLKLCCILLKRSQTISNCTQKCTLKDHNISQVLSK